MTATSRPLISVIIPTYNEEAHIGAVLDDLLSQDYGHSRLETLVADGGSTDSTREIVQKKAGECGGNLIKLIDNPERYVPSGLNLAIGQSRGEIIVRMDAHSRYPKDYLSTLVRYLLELGADNVGGMWITLPADGSKKARAIALALSHPLGVGNASYRLGSDRVKEVDTVPYGCYRREVFDRIGLFDQQLLRNQDDEFNARLKRAGGKIFIIPQVKILYQARGDYTRLGRMYYQYGYFKPLVNRKIKLPANLRQLAPVLLIVILLVLLLLGFWHRMFFWMGTGFLLFYTLVVLTVSFKLAITSAGGRELWKELVKSFLTVHFCYGWGYLKGVWDFLIWRKEPEKPQANR
jgi:glycosyltransferase involved in cell wall biosynthesis